MQTETFQLVVDGAPYDVQATPFTFNTETRFNVSYNGSDNYVFAWDSNISLFTAIGTEALAIPDNLEEAISQQLLKVLRQAKV
jgi:hypothetical protein